MYGQHITPRPKTPIARRLHGFMTFFIVAEGRAYPRWCVRRYDEAWPFRPRRLTW